MWFHCITTLWGFQVVSFWGDLKMCVVIRKWETEACVGVWESLIKKQSPKHNGNFKCMEKSTCWSHNEKRWYAGLQTCILTFQFKFNLAFIFGTKSRPWFFLLLLWIYLKPWPHYLENGQQKFWKTFKLEYSTWDILIRFVRAFTWFKIKQYISQKHFTSRTGLASENSVRQTLICNVTMWG